MLESVNPDLVAHQGSPTKHPARRLETIRAAGELRIPFTSGILVGIGETRGGAHRARWRRWPRCTPSTATCRRSSSRTSSRTARYYGAGAGRDRRPRPPSATGRPGIGDAPAPRRCPTWAHRRSSRSTTCASWSRDARELMPDVGIQVPPNLADWWPELVAAGATDLGGLSANGDHISPEHPFPSPHQVRKRLAADGVALTERLCVYAQYIDPEWVAQGVLDVVKTQATGASSRAAARAAPSRRGDAPRPRGRGDRPRPRRASALSAGRADGAVRRDPPGGDRGHARRPPTSCAPSWRATR